MRYLYKGNISTVLYHKLNFNYDVEKRLFENRRVEMDRLVLILLCQLRIDVLEKIDMAFNFPFWLIRSSRNQAIRKDLDRILSALSSRPTEEFILKLGVKKHFLKKYETLRDVEDRKLSAPNLAGARTRSFFHRGAVKLESISPRIIDFLKEKGMITVYPDFTDVPQTTTSNSMSNSCVTEPAHISSNSKPQDDNSPLPPDSILFSEQTPDIHRYSNTLREILEITSDDTFKNEEADEKVEVEGRETVSFPFDDLNEN